MLGAAVVGGLILAMIEGISLGLSRMTGSAMLQEQLSNIILDFWNSFIIFETVLFFKMFLVQQQQMQQQPPQQPNGN